LSWDIAADGDFADVILRIWQVGKEKDDPRESAGSIVLLSGLEAQVHSAWGE